MTEAERGECGRNFGVLIEARRDTHRILEALVERLDFEPRVGDGEAVRDGVNESRLLSVLEHSVTEAMGRLRRKREQGRLHEVVEVHGCTRETERERRCGR